MSQLFVDWKEEVTFVWNNRWGWWHLQLIKILTCNETVEEMIQVTGTMGSRKCKMHDLESKRELEVVKLKASNKSMIDVGKMSLVWRKVLQRSKLMQRRCEKWEQGHVRVWGSAWRKGRDEEGSGYVCVKKTVVCWEPVFCLINGGTWCSRVPHECLSSIPPNF